MSELLEFPLPFVVDLYEATVEDVEFRIPAGEPAARLAPAPALEVPSVVHEVTFTHSMGRPSRDDLAPDVG